MNTNPSTQVFSALLREGEPQFAVYRDMVESVAQETCRFYKLNEKSAIVEITSRNCYRQTIGVRCRYAKTFRGNLLWLPIPHWMYKMLCTSELDGPYVRNTDLFRKGNP